MRRRSVLRSGFTLLELLIALAVISVLIAILLPALSATRNTSRDIECRTRLRSVCEGFIFFADASGVGSRGDSDRLGDNQFLLEDYQESVYGIAEFWQGPARDRAPLAANAKGLLCPSSAGRLERRPRTPCSGGAIEPQRNVSVAFNRRLHVRTRDVNGTLVPATTRLTSQILHYPEVPLALDVDGAQAVGNGAQPYYTAPPILNDKLTDIYESGAFWFPSNRHRARLNVAFVGGHVLSTAHPTGEPWWRWNYQPNP